MDMQSHLLDDLRSLQALPLPSLLSMQPFTADRLLLICCLNMGSRPLPNSNMNAEPTKLDLHLSLHSHLNSESVVKGMVIVPETKAQSFQAGIIDGLSPLCAFSMPTI